MTDIADIMEGFESLKAAKAGDLTLIAARLEQGKLTTDETNWLAAEIRGDHKGKPGRKKASHQKNGLSPAKLLFKDSNDIDLAAWEAFNHLTEIDGAKVGDAERVIAAILAESERHVKSRVARVRQHIASGQSPSSYITSCAEAAALERIREAMIRTGLLSSARAPFLLALAGK